MDQVARNEFSNLRKNGKGFEIISLKSFFESNDVSVIGKAYRTDFYNLIYVTQGKCVHEIDFLEYTISEGELLIVSSNRVHKYGAFENIDGYLVMFTEGFLCEYLSYNSPEIKDLFSKTYLTPHIKSIDLFTTLFNKLLDVMYYSYTNSNGIINDDIIASTFKTFTQLILNVRLSEETYKKRNNDIFIQFTKLVEEHIGTEKTVEGYANMMHVSKKTVNLMSRKAIDISAKQYIIQQLIQKIQIKLCFEKMNINQISDELGFAEASNMTNFFKKYTDLSPSEFRSMNTNTDDDFIENESIDLDSIKESIEKKVYHITSEIMVPFHKHANLNEIFYCIKGSGFGMLEEVEVVLNVGDSFIAPAGKMHALRSDGDLYIISLLVPVINKSI